MKSSWLYGMNVKYEGIPLQEFSNSWWWFPIGLNIWSEKYMGAPLSITRFRQEDYHQLEQHIEKNGSVAEWMMWNMMVGIVWFSVEEAHQVSAAIRQFVVDHRKRGRLDDKPPFSHTVIRRRFEDIAAAIDELPTIHPSIQWFAISGPDHNDRVEACFQRNDSEDAENPEEALPRIPLSKQRQRVATFALATPEGWCLLDNLSFFSVNGPVFLQTTSVITSGAQ